MRPHYPIALAWLRSALVIVLLGMTCTTATAETKQLWTGNATFDDWGDVVNISAQQMAGVSADDIVRFVIEAGEVGSIALMSAEAQTIVLQQATLHAKDNAIEHTTMPQNAAKVYDMQGRCRKEMLKGVNIIVTTKENGEATAIKRINR